MSGAALGSDVEGVGPNVVLKQMYYRDNTRLDLGLVGNQFSCLPVRLYISLSSIFSLLLLVLKAHISRLKL